VKVVIIEGRGKGFCGGYDLQLYAEKEGENAGWQESDRTVFLFDDFECLCDFLICFDFV
jgi:enoyl-CoA hydratase/carnithine racemase